MKKIVSIAVAVVMMMAVLCTPVNALDLEKKDLFIQIWAQDTATWSWKAANDGSQIAVNLGETVEVVYTDTSAWQGLDTSATINMGLQVLDETLTANGEHSTVKYQLSDLVIKAKGYDDLVVKVAGTYDCTHDTVRPSWTDDDSIVGNSAEDYSFSPADIGITSTADYIDWFKAIESMTVTVTYLAYNGEGATAAAPETTTETETTPEPEAAPAPETTTPAPATETTKAPSTGLALAVVPAVMALAAVAVSKKH